MHVDKLDSRILNALQNLDGKTSITTIAKELFDTDSRKEIQKADSKVRTRLKKYKRNGLIEEADNGGTTGYQLKQDKVWVENHMRIVVPERDNNPENVIEMQPPRTVFITKDDSQHLSFHGQIPKQQQPRDTDDT